MPALPGPAVPLPLFRGAACASPLVRASTRGHQREVTNVSPHKGLADAQFPGLVRRGYDRNSASFQNRQDPGLFSRQAFGQQDLFLGG